MLSKLSDLCHTRTTWCARASLLENGRHSCAKFSLCIVKLLFTCFAFAGKTNRCIPLCYRYARPYICSSHLSISEGFSLAYIGLSPLGKPLDLLSLLWRFVSTERIWTHFTFLFLAILRFVILVILNNSKTSALIKWSNEIACFMWLSLCETTQSWCIIESTTASAISNSSSNIFATPIMPVCRWWDLSQPSTLLI